MQKPEGTAQEFVWIAEYVDGTSLKEQENYKAYHFNDIKKDKLKRFWLRGDTEWAVFDTETGTFDVNGKEYNVKLRLKDRDIDLTGRTDTDYTDIINFKKAYSNVPLGGRPGSARAIIEAYFTGFKTVIEEADGLELNVQITYGVSMVTGKTFFGLRVVSNKEFAAEAVLIEGGKEEVKEEEIFPEGEAQGMSWRLS